MGQILFRIGSCEAERVSPDPVSDRLEDVLLRDAGYFPIPQRRNPQSSLSKEILFELRKALQLHASALRMNRVRMLESLSVFIYDGTGKSHIKAIRNIQYLLDVVDICEIFRELRPKE